MKFLRCFATAVVSAGLFLRAEASSELRNPLRAITIVENAEIHTPSHKAHAASSFDLSFLLYGSTVRLKLEPNNDVLAEGATVNYVGPDGESRVEIIERRDHRIYKGSVWIQRAAGADWSNVGWARIVLHKDGKEPIFEGAFRMDGDHHHVHTSEAYMSTKRPEDPATNIKDAMVVWRDSDVMDNHEIYGGELKKRSANESTCMSDELGFNTSPLHPLYNGFIEETQSSFDPFGLFKRYGDDVAAGGGNGAGIYLQNHIGSTAGCPTQKKVALVGIATDCGYTGSFSSQEAARINIIDQMNRASQLFEETFNIMLGIQNLTISDPVCPTTEQAGTKWNRACNTPEWSINKQLNLFSEWRSQRQDNNAFWTLLTSCVLGPAVGNAWLGQVCFNGAINGQREGEVSSGANVVVKVPNEWLVIAHEVGHTFGAVHDCAENTCSDGTREKQQCCPLSANSCPASGRFVMNPSTGSNIQNFSPCSIGNICTAIGRGAINTQCLTDNRNVPLITGAQCGNGIVEMGEECDCGGPDGCGINICCDPTTCKYNTFANAVCDPSNEDCCTDTCQFAGANETCRVSSGECDPAEQCSGTAAGCPADEHAPNGQKCGLGDSGLKCASGQCTNQDEQCRTMMGVYNQSGNTTYACYNRGCMAKCASPELPDGVCYEMGQSFLDGTDCYGGGKCSNTRCEGGSIAGEFKSWIEENKPLFIGLVAGIGGLIVLSILSCIISSIRRRSKRRKAEKAAAAMPMSWRPQGPNRGYSHLAQNSRAGPGEYQGWNSAAPGQNYDGGWNAPPAAYGGGGGGGNQGWQPSGRYA